MSLPPAGPKTPLIKDTPKTRQGDIFMFFSASLFNDKKMSTLEEAANFLLTVTAGSPSKQQFWDANNDRLGQMLEQSKRTMQEIVPVFYVVCTQDPDDGHLLWNSCAVNYFLKDYLKERQPESYQLVGEDAGIWLCGLRTPIGNPFFKLE